MTLQKKILIPDYIYAARTTTEAITYFERLCLESVERYPDDVTTNEDIWVMAKRIAYVFFERLKVQMIERNGEINPRIKELGDHGFAWRFLGDCLNEDSVVYAFGIGTNMTFEVELAKKYGCEVKCFDPTPQAMEHALPIAREEKRIAFYPYGVLSKDGLERFYKPTDPNMGSLSATNLTYSNTYYEAPVLRLRTMMKRMGNEKIDLLKMDIEGAEYGVLDDLLFSDLIVDQICLEFDQPVPPWRTERYIKKLMLSGYELIDIWGLNCLFVKENLLTPAKKKMQKKAVASRKSTPKT